MLPVFPTLLSSQPLSASQPHSHPPNPRLLSPHGWKDGGQHLSGLTSWVSHYQRQISLGVGRRVQGGVLNGLAWVRLSSETQPSSQCLIALGPDLWLQRLIPTRHRKGSAITRREVDGQNDRCPLQVHVLYNNNRNSYDHNREHWLSKGRPNSQCRQQGIPPELLASRLVQNNSSLGIWEYCMLPGKGELRLFFS